MKGLLFVRLTIGSLGVTRGTLEIMLFVREDTEGSYYTHRYNDLNARILKCLEQIPWIYVTRSSLWS